MNKTLVINILLLVALYSCGQNAKTVENPVNKKSLTADTVIIDESKITTKKYSNLTYFHTEANYIDSTGQGIIIQNGFPRGGGSILASDDRTYGHAVFWSRIINKTDTLLELTIHFPADSIVIFPSSHAHFKLLVPSDTMTMDKVSEFNYGLENIESFAKSNLHQASQIQRTINPHEECSVYVVLLSHLSSSDNGISRTGLFLKEQNLYYRLTVDSLTSKLIHCGHIAYHD